MISKLQEKHDNLLVGNIRNAVALRAPSVRSRRDRDAWLNVTLCKSRFFMSLIPARPRVMILSSVRRSHARNAQSAAQRTHSLVRAR